MFKKIRVQLECFELGLINESQLSKWLRFHEWIIKRGEIPA